MKKAVFMADGLRLHKIYPESLKQKMAATLELTDLTLPNADSKTYIEFLKKQDASFLRSVSFIFSSWGMPEIPGELVSDLFPDLEAVFYASGSVRGFARPFLERGVKVISAWAANAEPVAEYTLGTILLANKAAFYAFRHRNKTTHLELYNYCDNYSGNYGSKVGILGAGMIGTRVIELLKPFSVQVLVFDPFCSDERARALGVQKASLEQVFSECDVISNHLANNEKTCGMLHYGLFSLMKDYASFINTGRGAQVVEGDLYRAAAEKPGRMIYLDVTYPEPISPDNPLCALENVFISPHIAGSMEHEYPRMSDYVFREYERYLGGEPLKYSVSLEMLETLA